MLFLPSEAVYAELHANFANVVEDSFRRKVWIVSPTTLWATLNTLRAVLRDVRIREDAHALQAALQGLIGDLGRLNQRVLNLQRHFDQATDDVRQVLISCEKAMARAARLDLSRLTADEGEAAVVPPPAASHGRGTGRPGAGSDLGQSRPVSSLGRIGTGT